MRQMLRKTAGRVVGSFWYLNAAGALDLLVGVPFALMARRGRRNTPETHLLIPPLGRGNIGDQAMLDAFLENVSGSVTVILARHDDLTVHASFRNRVEVIAIPKLFSVFGRIRSRLVFLRCLTRSSTLSVVGADIMDGGYSRRISMLRISMLTLARVVGVPAQVLGFSWKDSADPLVARAMKRASGHARLIVRDPVSARRMRDYGIVRVVQGADLVFAAEQSAEVADLSAWLDARAERSIVVINASGLIDQKVDLYDDYVELIERARSRDAAVIFLPHVIRTGDDDRQVSRRLKARGGWGDETLFVDRKLSPQEVSWLVSKVDWVITGRMHLAIMALRNSKPAYVLATQGKVEGLMELFNSPELVVDPKPGFAAQVMNRLEGRTPESEKVLQAGVALCVRLAQENFMLTDKQSPNL